MKMNPNPINKLPSRERTELEKYVRFLVFKMSQVIVQSRFGEKRKAVCSSKSSFHDWFNLAIEDNSEIQVKAKEAYSNVIPLKDFCICTEILLKTADGDILVLETWSLRMTSSDFFCDSPHISYTSLASVYSRMTLLLKSVIAVTRITPAYKLSCRQSADMYVILFRIYPGEPQVHQLGEHYQKSKIGEVLTPVGTIKMSVSYRSKDDMTITPQKVEKGSPFMMKSDYFKPDMSPQKVPTGGIRIDRNSNCNGSINECQKVGAFASTSSLIDFQYPDLIQDTFEKLSILEKPIFNIRSKMHCAEENKDGPNSDKNANLKTGDYARENKEDSSVDFNLNPTKPFNPSVTKEVKGREKLMDFDSNPREGRLASSSESAESGDFIVKPPFADDIDDLGDFFREFQSAPPLSSLTGQQTLAQSLCDVDSQILKFEQDMKDYDDFVDSVCNLELEK